MKRHSNSAAARHVRRLASRLRQQGVRTVAPRPDIVEEAPGPALGLADRELAPVLEGSDGASLASAKAHWFFGDWNALAALDLETLHGHPDRDRFALLVGSAHQQLGRHEAARRFVRQALDWGCPHKLVARVLIAGVHNTLGRAAALKEDERRIALHFKAAVAAGDSGETALASHARSVREMARLGLLPQAATLLDAELRAVSSEPRPQLQDSRIKILETEVELLRSSLALAQQRDQLFASPPDGVSRKGDAGRADWHADLKKRSCSQLGQDLWVLERTGYKRGGYFVEFGATDGVLLSNSLLLERDFGWRGICAEPNPKFLADLRRNRRCQVSDACVGSRTGDSVEFLLADEYGGLARHADLDNNAERRRGYLEDPARTVRLQTVSLQDLLVRHRAPRHIDYLSIDTEGSECDILSAFPFQDWRIDLITVEHNFTPQREDIRRLLEANGYSRVEAEWDDWYYLNDQRAAG